MRHIFCALAFCIFLFGVSAAADASPFCPADVGFMTPWDFALDAPSATDTSAHYAYRLKDDGTDVLSGHIVLAGDAQTYTLAFKNVHFTDSNNSADDPDYEGDEFAADGAFLSLPAPFAVRYAWVSDVTDSSGAVTKCPIFPYKLDALTPEDRQRMTSAPPPKGVHVMYNDRLATLGASLPAASCPVPYRDTKPDGEMNHYTQFYDPSIAGKPVVTAAAAVDPNGKVVAAAVLKSSGSQVYDSAAKEEVAGQKFVPALFDCEPAAGIYFFEREYYMEK